MSFVFYRFELKGKIQNLWVYSPLIFNRLKEIQMASLLIHEYQAPNIIIK